VKSKTTRVSKYTAERDKFVVWMREDFWREVEGVGDALTIARNISAKFRDVTREY